MEEKDIPAVIAIQPTAGEENSAMRQATVALARAICFGTRNDIVEANQRVSSIVQQQVREAMYDMHEMMEALQDTIGSHDIIRNPNVSACNGQPKKWNCLVCKAPTRHVCNHPDCQAWRRSNGMLGTPLCGPRADSSKNPEGLTCMQIHRQRLRDEKTGSAQQHST
ncbi:hypothetical protein FisN_13Lh318 [Fistulifera solaris]|uniref:Uncharacterized protein n=1 Tax=Fistulifera solaris TaxID=1519565 RepID=A0A1Z5KM37_FISSO|nr:hypothetical protein FisN_13Lh318 [Fistulifera solaris]|eukprot:GAX27132.1 hypothetical protein FisN_13Lh318 [Fistulifera solaris]